MNWKTDVCTESTLEIGYTHTLPFPNSTMQGIEPLNNHSHEHLPSSNDERLQPLPRHSLYSSVNEQHDWHSLCKQLHQPGVSFSENSTMYLYSLYPVYEKNKSYSKSDLKISKRTLLSDALQVMRRIVSSEVPPVLRPCLKHLIKKGIVDPEEIHGLEHLVVHGSPMYTHKLRRDHVQAVLMEQERLKFKTTKEDLATKLGDFSTSRSSTAVHRAKLQAAY